MNTLVVNDEIQIDERELVEHFVRASGPGGQNVNKVSTAVELRFDVRNSASLPDWLRERILKRRDRRLTQDGVLVLSAQRFRTQDRNRLDARLRLIELVRGETVFDKPRIATRPSKASTRRRLDGKQQRSMVKKNRNKPGMDA